MIRVWSVTPYTVSVTNKKILEPPDISGITIYKIGGKKKCCVIFLNSYDWLQYLFIAAICLNAIFDYEQLCQAKGNKPEMLMNSKFL